MEVPKKILYCATVDYHFKAFHLPYMKWFKEQGWQVHVAAKGSINLPDCDKKYDIPIERSPFKLGNLKAYKELKRIIDENNYGIIHVHTPMAGVLARLAGRTARKRGAKVIYTAHGFHFCKGAAVLNWMIYYPIERWLSHYTDSLITINSEDYNLAVKHKFKADKIERVHGVGVDRTKFKPVSESEKVKLREKHGYKKEDFLLYYIAELNKNKNQGLLLKSVSKAKEKISNIKLLLAGNGALTDYYKSMAKQFGIENNVSFLGFRKDVDEIAQMSDIAVASSFREGLPVNIMEAMACGKPVIATDNRGHRELIKNNHNGFIVDCHNESGLVKRICELYYSEQLRSYFSRSTINEVSTYDLSNVKEEMKKIYSNITNSRENISFETKSSFQQSSI
jgi:glycosyltransferase EpsD